MSTTAPPPAAAPAPPGPPPSRRYETTGALAAALRRAAPALLGYAAVRALGTLVLMKWAHALHHGLWPLLATQWDSDWYLAIAGHGYEHTLGHPFHENNLAFFPLYPVLIKAVAAAIPGSRPTAGLLIAVGCSLLAAWGVFAVGDRLHGRRVGTVLAVLWGTAPVAVIEWMGYTESLFTALAAWSLYAVLTGRWLAAGGLALLAGLTRPTGLALAAAVSLCALLALRRRPGGVASAAPAPRLLAAALLAPLGWLGYVGWVGLRLGRADGYFVVQKMWHNEWDGGAETLRSLRSILGYQTQPQLFYVVVSLVLIGSGVLYVLCLADRQPLPLLVFSGVLLAIVLGSGGVYFPRARFLLPGFPLLLPLARGIVRARRRTAVLALGGAALASAYVGAYMMLVYTGAP
ncbi:hypothetical protein [Streptomyces sp. CT34]|uniref:hypothetical protein n=1 Tax=Streptomyces sp. CT34 TaxID=1553907 RepID=UPI00099B38EF|nr:hypothetical protein [Streptomyces sp. CT34]